jgi:cytochrome o ubiquinol oxidase subunit 1
MTNTPVPFYNFAVSPQVHTRDELSFRYANKLAGVKPDHYPSIHMPNNTPIPLIIGAFAMAFGFGLVWRIWWLAGLGLLGMIATVIYRSFARDAGYTITSELMAKLEAAAPLGVVAESQYISQEGAH